MTALLDSVLVAYMHAAKPELRTKAMCTFACPMSNPYSIEAQQCIVSFHVVPCNCAEVHMSMHAQDCFASIRSTSCGWFL